VTDLNPTTTLAWNIWSL